MTKERIVIICPGRGTYTRETSGYLATFGASAKNQIAYMDDQRKLVGNSTLTELDSKPFRAKFTCRGNMRRHLFTLVVYLTFFPLTKKNMRLLPSQEIPWGGIVPWH